MPVNGLTELLQPVVAQVPACGNSIMPAVIGIVFLFYLLVMRPQARERSTRDQMLKELKKNDKVMTIGGLYGIVASVSTDKDEVVLKVDEETNTKLRFSRASIHRVISDETADDKKSK